MMRSLTIAVLCALTVSACASGPTSPIAGAADPAALAQFEARSYQLSPGDEVRVNVFGEESLSGDFVVSGQGVIVMPLIGDVQAAGLTIGEFRNAVAASLQDGYLNDPRVSVEVLNYRPIFVLGEVGESGEYPYAEGLTVMNAVARAGGFTYRANTRVVFIKRAGADGEVAIPLDADVPVMPGDTIRIAERYF